MENMCQVCEDRYALYKILTSNNHPVSICMICLREKISSGDFKVKGQDRVDFLNNLSTSISQDNKQESENLPAANTLNKTAKKDEKKLFVLNFGFDLTKKAKENQLDPIIGREQEIENALRIMNKRTKNNPLLVGEPGTGKSAIVEGIAHRIASGNVYENLKNKTLVSLSVANLIAGTKYRGEFEDRLKKIVEEASERKDVILFIDEFHQITSGGGGESLDAGNMLKPALARGDIQIIGATTSDEYRMHIEKDKALSRRFQKVIVDEPSTEETVEIIKGIRPKYEAFHSVSISDEVIMESVALSEKYINDRRLPDKAIDLIDEACALISISNHSSKDDIRNLQDDIDYTGLEKEEHLEKGNLTDAQDAVKKEKQLQKQMNDKKQELKNRLSISKDDLAFILNKWTGIPASNMTTKEIERLQTLESDLMRRVKGQDSAIKSISNSIKRSQVGLKDDNRPVGVFLFLGPTGVGKTELSKALTSQLLASEDNMIRLDMSEYMEKHSVSKLIGSPPGYVGYEDEGELTKKLRQKPYSVVLFDEIEKAHPDVQNVLLQLYDEGRITSGQGLTVDAKNAVFIMTSNVGSDLYGAPKRSVGYSTNLDSEEKDLKEQIMSRLKSTYRPEFLNRIDDFIIFNKLSKEAMLGIAENMTQQLVTKLSDQEKKLSFTEEAIKKLSEEGFDPEFGARPLRRKLDDIKTLIADKLVENYSAEVITVQVKNEVYQVKTK